MPDDDVLAGLTARLERLERNNRRLWFGFAGSVGALATLMLTGATAGVPTVLRAQRFAVVRADGTEVDSFGLKPNGSRLYNDFEMGKPKGDYLTLSPGGLVLTSHRSSGPEIVNLDATGLNLSSPRGGILLADANEPELPAKILARVKPELRKLLSVRISGPLLDLEGRRGSRAQLSLGGPAPSMTMQDPLGFAMAIGGTDLVTPATGETRQTSAASIVMFGNDKGHKVIWQAPN